MRVSDKWTPGGTSSAGGETAAVAPDAVADAGADAGGAAGAAAVAFAAAAASSVDTEESFGGAFVGTTPGSAGSVGRFHWVCFVPLTK